jgi:hypothetical protein
MIIEQISEREMRSEVQIMLENMPPTNDPFAGSEGKRQNQYNYELCSSKNNRRLCVF